MAAQVEKWANFEVEDEEEALSLRDFPSADDNKEENYRVNEAVKSPATEDFEFRTFGSGGGGLSSNPEETDMCAADEVFFQGQILPLRPSVSSDGGWAFPHSRCGSRSESMDRYCSSSSSVTTSSRSSISLSSSSSISRSHSTHSSASSGGGDAPRLSISSNFYTHPSPKPHLPTRTNSAPRRKSTSSSSAAAAGWGLLRLGLVRTPEIELQDLRQRKASIGHGNGGNGSTSRRHDGGELPKTEKIKVAGTCKGEKKSKGSERKVLGLFRNRFSCKCSPDDVTEPISSISSSSSSRVAVDERRRKEEGSVSRRHRDEVRCHSSRTFQWLEELNIGKAPVA